MRVSLSLKGAFSNYVESPFYVVKEIAGTTTLRLFT
jgi:hypothetical protein